MWNVDRLPPTMNRAISTPKPSTVLTCEPVSDKVDWAEVHTCPIVTSDLVRMRGLSLYRCQRSDIGPHLTLIDLRRNVKRRSRADGDQKLSLALTSDYFPHSGPEEQKMNRGKSSNKFNKAKRTRHSLA